ncbi:MAG: DNA topoisomerase IV subunit A [Bacillota bacterium]|nr:DNA topoisomerase IV subunit A [Bacillota bacterium]
MPKKIDIPKDNNIIKVSIDEVMPDNYLPYAVEVAKDRALPDVRDGLKPVHRRILYGAYMLKAFPDKPYYKSARIVGDILGKYHPHGDTSVYDAMVILAQNFTTRMPLIDGHGNWGSQDGDSAAAMRYTEARMTNIAMEMIKDIDKDVVNMIDNYSATEQEPEVLPAKYPNLLVNGAFGIAVGLATNIPPHNLIEVVDASLACIEKPDITTKELIQYVKGPDLPTGGVLIGKNALLSAYETGIGKVTLRAKTSIEKLENGRPAIIITEFPYRKSKAKMLQLISEMTGDKRHEKALESIIDIRDESDRTGIRAVIELKKSADEAVAEKVLKYLFKKTDLQCNISFNMVALSNGKPETMGLKTILVHYINHRKEVVTRRTKKELEIAEKRFHIVEGFIKAIDIIDEIIATIRSSKSKKDSENNLAEKFGFTELQAEAIVELMLYRLTGLEIKIFEKEYKELEKEIKKLKKILESEKELFNVIKKELNEVKEKYGDERRTAIIEDDEEAKIDIEELVVVEDTMVTLSNDGFIKRVPLKSYNRSNTNIQDIEYREGDYNKFLFQSNTKDSITIFTDKGNMYQLKGSSIPEYKWKDKGERIDTLIKGLDLSVERIITIYSIPNMASQQDILFLTSKGNYKKTNLDKFITVYSKISALKLKDDEKLIIANLMDRDREESFIKMKTSLGIEFTIEEPKLSAVDRNILGTQLVNVLSKDEIVSAEYVDKYIQESFYLMIDNKGNLKKCTKNNNKEKLILTSSQEKIMFFASDGNVFIVPSVMLQNIENQQIALNKLFESEKIISMISVENFNEDEYVYFFSKSGMIKKTKLSEFEGNYSNVLGYKLKSANDCLVNVEIGNDNNEDIFIFTRRAMCIRFCSETVSLMGKVASGVTGISLREDDEVIYGFIKGSTGSSNMSPAENELAITKTERSNIILLTNKKNKKNIKLNDIKLQNRAGRGSNVMLVVMDEYVEKVEN